jgi:signal transduction histidine kinase/ActR/RegA family two-component response regulator
VTATKQAEEQLRELNDSLETRAAERATELAEAQEQLRQSQKLDALGQLTGGVAHDFNNLLTVIRSSAALLGRPGLSEERRRRYLDAISDTTNRAATLTRQLLAFARRQALKPEVFDAADRVDAIAAMLQTLLGSGIELTIEARCSACWVEADLSQFETALVNLALNARDAMHGEGKLAVVIKPTAGLPAIRSHTEVPGNYVAVSVTDTGTGISPETLGRIFEPFFTTKDVGKGTGLGLSQVYGFAKQSGGDVDVSSQPGEGAMFTLYLPRAELPATVQAEATAPSGARLSRSCRVLIVEDDTQVGEFAAQLLSDHRFETIHVTDATLALNLLDYDRDAFDVVFSDVVMPGISGVELGRIIRLRWPELPVVLTSGYSHVLAADAGHGFPLLHKPYSVEDLSQILQQVTAANERNTPVPAQIHSSTNTEFY